MEIFAALTGKSLGFVDFIEAQTIADFLKLPSRWHLQICDVNKILTLPMHGRPHTIRVFCSKMTDK
jgi:hypothetical protein